MVVPFASAATPLRDAMAQDTRLAPVINRSKTLRDLIQSFCRIASSQRSHGDFQLTCDGKLYWFGYHGPTILKRDVQIELYRITSMIQLIQLAAGSGWSPERVELKMSEIELSKRCPLIKPCSITFFAEVSRVSIPEILLRLPVNLEVPMTLPVNHYDYSINTSFVGTLRQIIPPYLERGPCKIEAISQVTEIPLRTLQRRLKARATSFNRLLGEIRFELAKERLADHSVRVKDVAVNLGYTDVTHFIRAFRRWSGMSPSQYRKLA